MSELIEFLRARLDEDEQAARAADVKQGDPDWWVSEVVASAGRDFTVRSRRDNRPAARVERLDGDDDEPGAILDGRAVADHIARHDPARVLRDVEATRLLIDSYQRIRERYGSTRRQRPKGWLGGIEWVLKLRALTYSDHQDYKQEWRPNVSKADVSVNITVNAYTCWQPIGPIEWEDLYRSQCPEVLRDEIDQHIPHRIAVRWSLLGIHAVHCSGCGRMLWQELSRGDVSLLP